MNGSCRCNAAMQNVVITGSTGFLGLALTEVLLKNNVNVFAVTRPGSDSAKRLPPSPGLQIIPLPLEKLTQVDPNDFPPIDCFYHLAWAGIRGAARGDAALQDKNLAYTAAALETAVRLGAHRFIGAGSQAEYAANTAYGKAKQSAYHLGEDFSAKHHLRFIWPRIFSLYGIGDDAHSLVMSCLHQMTRHEPVDLTLCMQLWDFLYVTDAAAAYFLLGENENANGVYHVASGDAQPLKTFVDEMARLTRTKSELRFGAIAYPATGMVSLHPTVKRLPQELGWRQQVSFTEGIQRILSMKDKKGSGGNEENQHPDSHV